MSKKEKGKIFVVIFATFAIVGFGMKWLVSELGWAPSTYFQHAQRSEKTYATSKLSLHEIEQAKRIGTQFMPYYFSQDKEKLRTISTENLFHLLQEEMESPLGREKPKLNQIGKIECDAQDGRVRCFSTVRVSEEGKSPSVFIEQVYEIMMLLKGTRWLVDEVNVRGSFE